MKSVVLLSGGLDSTVLVAHLLDSGDEVHTVSVDYGQRHRVELRAAHAVARYYGLPHDVVDLSPLGRLLSGSALTDPTVDVPDGHYADESMRATVVPNRNAIMISVAVGIAAARGFNRVATAVHAGDHPIYPDCRAEFIYAATMAAEYATVGYGDVTVVAPFVVHDKTWIAARGAELRAPLELTWSCYKGVPEMAEAWHCGTCGTCTERREAFALAGVADPTPYLTWQPAAGDAARPVTP
jgi:7-cyano-7-deazaguanine synthase